MSRVSSSLSVIDWCERKPAIVLQLCSHGDHFVFFSVCASVFAIIDIHALMYVERNQLAIASMKTYAAVGIKDRGRILKT